MADERPASGNGPRPDAGSLTAAKAKRALRSWSEAPVRIALRERDLDHLRDKLAAALDCGGSALEASGVHASTPGDPTAVRVCRRERLRQDIAVRAAELKEEIARIDAETAHTERLLMRLDPPDEALLTAIYRDRLTLAGAALASGISRSSVFRRKRAAELRFGQLLEQEQS